MDNTCSSRRFSLEKSNYSAWLFVSFFSIHMNYRNRSPEAKIVLPNSFSILAKSATSTRLSGEPGFLILEANSKVRGFESRTKVFFLFPKIGGFQIVPFKVFRCVFFQHYATHQSKKNERTFRSVSKIFPQIWFSCRFSVKETCFPSLECHLFVTLDSVELMSFLNAW